MLKKLVVLPVIICLICGCAKRQHGLTIENGVLTIGVEVNYPPMEFYDTDSVTMLGFDIDLTKALAERLGLKVKYIDVAWEGILAGLDTRRYDAAVNITVLPERQKRYNFTQPYIDSFIIIAALKDFNADITAPEDIAGFRVAFQGNTTAQYFTERLNEQGVKFSSFSYEKIINCFDDLKLKRVDFVVVDNIVGFYYAQRENSPFQIVWQGSSSDEFIAICLKKGSDTLTAALNNALNEMTASGELTELYRKWGQKKRP